MSRNSKAPGFIPRPHNAFMVWSIPLRREMLAKGVATTTASRDLGKMWKEMSEEEKKPYFEEARVRKEEHKKLYPNYRYNPARRALQRAERERERKEKKLLKKQKTNGVVGVQYAPGVPVPPLGMYAAAAPCWYPAPPPGFVNGAPLSAIQFCYPPSMPYVCSYAYQQNGFQTNGYQSMVQNAEAGPIVAGSVNGVDVDDVSQRKRRKVTAEAEEGSSTDDGVSVVQIEDEDGSGGDSSSPGVSVPVEDTKARALSERIEVCDEGGKEKTLNKENICERDLSPAIPVEEEEEDKKSEEEEEDEDEDDDDFFAAHLRTIDKNIATT